VTAYKPTVLVTEEKAELHLQQHHETGLLRVSKEPEGGYYLLVADVRPLATRKTEVILYRASKGQKALVNAVKGWATGENYGCPDLTAN
jgi:hypothetical protein